MQKEEDKMQQIKAVRAFKSILSRTSNNDEYSLVIQDERGKDVFICDHTRFDRWSLSDRDGKEIYSEVRGNKYWYGYDDNGSLLYKEELRVGAEKALKTSWKNEYDEKGRLCHSTCSNGEERWLRYDKQGNIIHDKTVDGGDVSVIERKFNEKGNILYLKEVRRGPDYDEHIEEDYYEYDKNNNCISHRRRNGWEHILRYNKNDQLIYERTSDNFERYIRYIVDEDDYKNQYTVDEVCRYGNDFPTQKLSIYVDDKLMSIIGKGGSQTNFKYDENGNKIFELESYPDGDTLERSRNFDQDGNLVYDSVMRNGILEKETWWEVKNFFLPDDEKLLDNLKDYVSQFRQTVKIRTYNDLSEDEKSIVLDTYVKEKINNDPIATTESGHKVLVHRVEAYLERRNNLNFNTEKWNTKFMRKNQDIEHRVQAEPVKMFLTKIKQMIPDVAPPEQVLYTAAKVLDEFSREDKEKIGAYLSEKGADTENALNRVIAKTLNIRKFKEKEKSDENTRER